MGGRLMRVPTDRDYLNLAQSCFVESTVLRRRDLMQLLFGTELIASHAASIFLLR